MSIPTEAEVVAAFQAFLDERAAAGVAAAQAVSRVQVDARTVTVEFDHQVAGFERRSLADALPFDNWAEFAGAPIMFDNPEGNYLRSGVDRVTTRFADGKEMGSMTAAELFQKATGRSL